MIRKSVVTIALAGVLLAGCGAGAGQEKAKTEEAQAVQEEAAATDSTDETASGEESTETATPWRDSTQEEAKQSCPRMFKAPEGATEKQWRIMDADPDTGEGQLVELDFVLNGNEFCARAQYGVDEDNEIHGLHYDWDLEDEVTLANWGEGNMQGKSYRVVEDDQTVDLITWYDIEIGIGYSLTVSAKDLDGFDIQAVAEQMYDESNEPYVGEDEAE
ncbi:MAG: hypothetical protein E7294_08920 [Lachnospiraceae bacterium]|nr:hypothetical protein [Lachnospiraceae bacterium]